MKLHISSIQTLIGGRGTLQRYLICLAVSILISGCAGHGRRESICYETEYCPEEAFNATGDADTTPSVQTVSYAEELPTPDANENLLRDAPEPLPEFKRVPPPPVDPQPETISVQEPFVIDLATTLKLGGASALDVQIAREKAFQAQVTWSKSRLLLLPTLWYGINWFHHDGSIQTTPGEVIDASRSSFYTGGGAGFEGQPITANGTGPGNFAFNLSIAEAHYKPLEKLQLSQAAQAAERGTQNGILRDLAVAYADILQARSELANYNVGRKSSQKLVEVTSTFSDVGLGSPAEVYRAKTEEAHWIVQVKEAERKVIISTTKLAEILQLDPEVQLLPAEEQLVPVTMVDENLSVQELIMIGLAERPEMSEYRAVADARLTKFRQERARPFLPYLQLAGSVGSFAGGTGSSIDDQSTRDDMVASMIWEVKNLGLGNYLINRRSRSEWQESQIKIERLQNRIIAEVIAAAGDSASYRRQINAAEEGLDAANQSYALNVERIRDAEGIPLELVQAIQARTNSQNRLTDAICNYNRSQYRLLHAIGQPSAIAMESEKSQTR
ncbi:MAG: TolC family protein [Pirellulales bacterium]|nr:TolC family protein [Pirellulales bacterium]